MKHLSNKDVSAVSGGKKDSSVGGLLVEVGKSIGFSIANSFGTVGAYAYDIFVDKGPVYVIQHTSSYIQNKIA